MQKCEQCNYYALDPTIYGLELFHALEVCEICYYRKKDKLPKLLEKDWFGYNGWIGCGGCDTIFPCHEGKQYCVRLYEPMDPEVL